MADNAPATRPGGFRGIQAVLALAAALLVGAWLVPLRSAPMTVTYTTDGTIVRTSDGQSRQLTAGTVVAEGDRVVVAEGGAVTLRAPDGHFISLADSAELVVEKAAETLLGGKVQTELRVDDGEVRVSGTGGGRTSLEIGLPNGLAGIRGTDLSINVNGGQALLSLHDGLVDVGDVTGETLSLEAGQGLILTESGASVRELPAQASILSPGAGAVVDSLGSQLVWSAVTGAASYLVEVASDSDFRSILFRAAATGTEMEIPTLEQDRPALIRVSAVTGEGLIGAPSPALNLDIRLRRAEGIALQAGGDVDGSIAAFQAAATNYPDDVTLFADLGWALYLGERHAEARIAYERAVELESEAPETRLELARVYFWLEEYELAEAEYQFVLESAANDADALWGLGDTYRMVGRAEEATDLVRRALALQPDHPYAAETLRQLRDQR